MLVVDYGKEGYGLPGGHLDAGETPDQGMARELFEELGLENVHLRHADFMQHANGKIILGYVGTLDPTTELKPQIEEMQGALWVDVDDVMSGKVSVPSYGELICNYNPNRINVAVS